MVSDKPQFYIIIVDVILMSPIRAPSPSSFAAHPSHSNRHDDVHHDSMIFSRAPIGSRSEQEARSIINTANAGTLQLTRHRWNGSEILASMVKNNLGLSRSGTCTTGLSMQALKVMESMGRHKNSGERRRPF